MKLTKTQQELLNKIKEAKEGGVHIGIVKVKNGNFELRANTRTLQALERCGYIQVIQHTNGCYGMNWDVIKVLF